MANKKVAYVLWLLFGWTGLHHVYLGRLSQAIVWFATLGGGCGVGWIRDIWKIPDYVEWSNGDKSAQEKHIRRALLSPKPGCSAFRFAGMIVMGFIAATALGAMVPDFNGALTTDPVTYYFLQYSFVALLVLGNAAGVFLVANIGELQCSKYYPFITSVCLTPLLLGKHPNVGLASFVTSLVTWYTGLRWRPLTLNSDEAQLKKTKFWKNMLMYIIACTMWLSLLAGIIYFNTTITTENGEKIPVREVISNFLKSDAWKQTKQSFVHLFNVYWHAGFGRAWSDASQLFDISGEINAYKVLDLPRGASQEEISKRCRKLSAENHPDRFKSQLDKDLAQEKFIEIQHACSALSSVQARRSKISKTSEDADS